MYRCASLVYLPGRLMFLLLACYFCSCLSRMVSIVVGHGWPVGRPRPDGHGFGQKFVPATGRGFFTGRFHVSGHGFGHIKPSGFTPVAIFVSFDLESLKFLMHSREPGSSLYFIFISYILIFFSSPFFSCMYFSLFLFFSFFSFSFSSNFFICSPWTLKLHCTYLLPHA
jgi:hypothetical protein